MASPDILNFDELLAPISGSNPAGVDLRQDPALTTTYYAVKDARSAARAIERQVMLDSEEESHDRADWRPIMEQGVKVIAEVSKDLEISAYLVEALVRLHGFAGARDGFRLVRELIERYWDTLCPMPDEDGLETRVAPLSGLNGHDGEGALISPLANIPVTEGKDLGPFGYSNYQQALSLATVSDEQTRAKRIQRGAVPMSEFERAVAESSPQFYAQLSADLTQCVEEFAKLNEVLFDKCGQDAPPSSNIRSTLEACLDMVKHVARDKLAVSPAADEAVPENGAVPADSGVAINTVQPARMQTREDALESLVKIAEFFRKIEPHSPVSYALEQVVRWGRMPLPDLLNELVPDRGPREYYSKLAGIVPPEDK